MPTSTVIAKLDKDQLRKFSTALAKQLLVKITLGVIVTVTVTLISTAVLNKIDPTDVELSE